MASPPKNAPAGTVPGKGASDNEAVDISISKKQRNAVAEALKQALGDSYAMYFKTLGVHWNVTGAGFYGIHKLTDAQYNELHKAADAIAERIRALGHVAPASFSEFKALSCVDVDTPHKSTLAMLEELVKDNEAVAKRMLKVSDVADDNNDKFTEDMIIARIGTHEENAWMLRATIA